MGLLHHSNSHITVISDQHHSNITAASKHHLSYMKGSPQQYNIHIRATLKKPPPYHSNIISTSQLHRNRIVYKILMDGVLLQLESYRRNVPAVKYIFDDKIVHRQFLVYLNVCSLVSTRRHISETEDRYWPTSPHVYSRGVYNHKIPNNVFAFKGCSLFTNNVNPTREYTQLCNFHVTMTGRSLKHIRWRQKSDLIDTPYSLCVAQLCLNKNNVQEILRKPFCIGRDAVFVWVWGKEDVPDTHNSLVSILFRNPLNLNKESLRSDYVFSIEGCLLRIVFIWSFLLMEWIVWFRCSGVWANMLTSLTFHDTFENKSNIFTA